MISTESCEKEDLHCFHTRDIMLFCKKLEFPMKKLFLSTAFVAGGLFSPCSAFAVTNRIIKPVSATANVDSLAASFSVNNLFNERGF